MKKKNNLIWVALVIILTILNLIPPSLIIYLVATNNGNGGLAIGILLVKWSPLGLAVGLINLKAILYYKSILRPHGKAKILIFAISLIPTLNIIYFGFALLTLIYLVFKSFTI
jgi:hypothetical protein